VRLLKKPPTNIHGMIVIGVRDIATFRSTMSVEMTNEYDAAQK
jgi:hypothetical protein